MTRQEGNPDPETEELKTLRRRVAELEARVAHHSQTEEALQESEERYRAIFENAVGGFFQSTPEGRFLRVNKAFAGMCGYRSPGEMVLEITDIAGQHYVHRQDREVFSAILREKGMVENFEHETHRKDGSTFWTSVSARAVRDDKNQLLYYEGTHEDIDDRKKAEKLLADTEEQYRSLFETSTNAILIRNREGIITMVNGAALTLLGSRKADDLMGKAYLDFVYPEDRALSAERIEKIFQIALDQHEPYEFDPQAILPREHRMVDLKGDRIYVESTGVAFHHKGELFIQGIFRNITERKQAEEALLRSEEAEKRLSQENAIIAQIGRIISSTLDIDDVYERFAKEAHRLISFDGISINIINLAEASVTIPYVSGIAVPGRQRGDVFSLHGSVTGEVMGTRSGMIIHMEDKGKLQTQFPNLLSAFDRGLRSAIVVPLISKDQVIGSIHFRSIRANAYSDPDLKLAESIGAQIAGAIANAQLFAARKQAEERLRLSEERYRTLSENAPFGMMMINQEAHFTYINPKFKELFGYDLKDVLEGRSWFRKAYPDPSYRREVIAAWVQDLEGSSIGEKRPRIFEVTCKDGSKKVINFISVQIETGATLVTCEDITDRKRAEEALRDSEERYRSLVANATDMIFIAQDGVLKFPNPATITLTGYSEEELATLPFVTIIHPEDREVVLERHERKLKGGEVPNTYSFRILTKGEEVRWVQLNSVLITWEGRPGILCSLRDITPQRRLEAQYLHAQKMEAVGTLAGGVAHDFNNLLQAVLGYAEMLLLEKKPDEPGHRALMAIREAAQRGAELTRQLLTFSRKVQSKPRPLHLNQEIVQVEQLLQRTIPKMIQVELRLGGDLWTVSADPVQIGQVLMNLAVNARDAMPEGGRLVIGTQNKALDEEFCRGHIGSRPGRHVILAVSDTGQGMEKEVLGHLFEPFFTTKGIGRGTGLGLAMVYGIVKGHGGYIECESELGKGTVFKIYLPAIEGEAEVEESEKKRKPRGGTETILLVDDEESLQDLGRAILSAFGYTVLTASDGKGALETYRAEKERIHLLILDLIMPGVGGLKCLEELLRINPDVRVVIATGYYPEDSVKAQLEGEGRGFISKPYDMSEMLRVVREVLDK
jgi:two-component system cell cycle sensor histidine kinase/response regulator CckA